MDDLQNVLDLRRDDRVELLLDLVEDVFVRDESGRQRVHLQVDLASFEHQVASNIHAVAGKRVKKAFQACS